MGNMLNYGNLTPLKQWETVVVPSILNIDVVHVVARGHMQLVSRVTASGTDNSKVRQQLDDNNHVNN